MDALIDFALQLTLIAATHRCHTLMILLLLRPLLLLLMHKSTCVDTFEHGCDVLAVACRPDGREVCCATTNGNLNVWDTDSGQRVRTIEARRDISGGRLTTDSMTADNAARSKYFTSVCYTADGTCILAGGRSKYVCIYVVATGALIKKFQLSHNRCVCCHSVLL